MRRAKYQHYKGGIYTLVHIAVQESDKQPVAVYADADGFLWVRPMDEFKEKFKQINTPTEDR